MTAEQFLQEVLESPICPTGFEKTYRDFQKYQQAAMDTLLELHRVCERNHITYQLAYGSLLGAIRDNGQIPWDYDTDVFVSFDDKLRLVEALKKDLDDRFYFYCPEVEKGCRHVIMRLAPKGYNTEALHVDVFYYTGTSNDIEKRKQHAEKIKKVSKARSWKLVKPSEASAGNLRRFLSLWKKKLGFIWMRLDKLEYQYDELCKQYPIGSSDYVISADSFADCYDFPRELFQETELYTTSNGTFRIPSKYHEMLSIMYKDYRNVPELEKRIHEVVVHYNRLKFFDKIK